MKIIVAGSNSRGLSSYVRKYNLMKLHSFLNEKGDISRWDDNYPLMVDSGAHSWNKVHDHIGMAAKKTLKPAIDFLDEYFEFIKEHKNKKFVWVELDVYNDLDISVIDEFYDRVMALGIKGKLMRVYHNYLDPKDGDYSTLMKWVDQGQDYIGLGADNLDNLDDIFTLTKDTVKYHGFALTRVPVIQKYPFFSVDSTSPSSTVIFGRYTTPIMAFKERKDVFKEKSIECFHDDWDRLERAVIETKLTENYITELWEKKGVIWDELSY